MTSMPLRIASRLRQTRPVAFALALMATILSGCSATGILNAVTTESDISVQRDLSYGPDSRQAYDLYRPTAVEPRAAIVFYYGGSWESGSRAMYEFVGATLARRGFIVAIPDYRLHPEVTFPVFVEDGALALRVIRERIGDTLPLFIMGHSAGAHIAGMIALAPRYLGAQGLTPCGTLAGFIGLSGPYDFNITERYQPIFPPETRSASQVLPFAEGRHPPSLLIHGLDDDTVEAEDSRLLADALAAGGNTVELELVPGASHVGIIGAFSWPLRFMAPTLDLVDSFVERRIPRPLACGETEG